jgi:hypothetical protein
MLKTIIAIGFGAGLALSPLVAVAQTDQSTTAPAASSEKMAPQKTGPHHPHRHMRRRRMHQQRTGHMPPHPAADTKPAQ